MDAIGRGLAVYLFLLLIFRMAGNRTMAQTTNFDLVLLLIISETTQQAMVNNDHSIANSALLILTLVGTSYLFSLLKTRFPRFEEWVDGVPLILVSKGKLLKDRMKSVRVDENDIMCAARHLHGLKRLNDIEYAILEHNGSISIIPRQERGG